MKIRSVQPAAFRPAQQGRRTAPKGQGFRELGDLLLPWYLKARRQLPWRDNPTPYSVWVSEIMLQQTRVETVIPYYKRFLKRLPDVEALATAPLEDVLALWSGLGYYRRARSLHEGARLVLAEHRGEFPRDWKVALEIPGVGPYTAGAVLSIAYNLPFPVVDGNVERVLTRLFRMCGDPRKSKNQNGLRDFVQRHIPEGRASEFNQALMELGATVCTPLSPSCERCPLATLCLARQRGDMTRYPESAATRKSVELTLHAGVVRNKKKFLIERVTRGSFLRGLWLFPYTEVKSTKVRGGKRDGSGRPGQPRASRKLLSSLSQKLGVRMTHATYLGNVRHSITYRRIRVEIFELQPPDEQSFADLDSSLRWARLEELGSSVPVSSLALKIAKLTKSHE